MFSTPVPAGWAALCVPTDRNSPGGLNYSNQPSRPFPWHRCLPPRTDTPLEQRLSHRCQGRWHCSHSYTRPVGRLWEVWGFVPEGVVLIGAIWDAPWLCTLRSWLEQSAERGALLGQGLCSSLQQIFFSGARQGWAGEDLASVHFSLLTLWQPLNEQTTRKQIWSSPRLRWPDLGC